MGRDGVGTGRSASPDERDDRAEAPVPSEALHIVVLDEGAFVPGYESEPRIKLRPADLVLLARLSARPSVGLSRVMRRVSEARGVEPEKLRRTVRLLRRRGLLVDRAGAPEPAPLELERVDPAPPLDSDGTWRLRTPVVVRLSAGRYVHMDHEGARRVGLTATELSVGLLFLRGATIERAFEVHTKRAGEGALERSAFDGVLRRLAANGLLIAAEPVESSDVEVRQLMVRSWAQLQSIIESRREAHEADERERANASGSTAARPTVYPVLPAGSSPSLSLGMIVAYAKAFADGALDRHFAFHPGYLAVEPRFPSGDVPSIHLFSNYMWSHEQNLAVSAELKEKVPTALTVHGGPDAPRYEGDVERYFAMNPHIDVVVRGEGEVTAAEMLAALAEAGPRDDGSYDLSCLADVPGLCYRDGDRVVRTADRDRIVDLNEIPSPFLTGLFDGFVGPAAVGILESNRGCPYGCTFCDWGSATLSRIRKFDLDRVFGELEWCAKNRVERIFMADANFGIFERDVEIAEKVAELKRTYGFPHFFHTNYAKNTVKHLRSIVEALAGAGILTEGNLSLQSMDESTLSTIHRSNIKLEKYDALAAEFRKRGLPLYVDFMVGLPGQTRASFRNDLQGCLEREMTAKIFPTELLVNSPMNDPAYRAEHEIGTAPVRKVWYQEPGRPTDDSTLRAPRRLVVSSSTFDVDDYNDMLDVRRIFVLFENHGVLRQVSRYVRQESGVREIDLYTQLRDVAAADPDQWPAVRFVTRYLAEVMVPPVSWRLFIDEVGRYVVDELGVADDDALRTVLDVQLALLPAPDRSFPHEIELPHDYVAWHGAMIDAKEAGEADWTAVVPRLRTLPPGHFSVDDHDGWCTRRLGYRMDDDFYGRWEFVSPVSRPLQVTAAAAV